MNVCACMHECIHEGDASRVPKIKLLKLILRKVNGDVTAWTIFWESTVYNN